MKNSRFAALAAVALITLSTSVFAQTTPGTAPIGAGKTGVDTTGSNNDMSPHSSTETDETNSPAAPVGAGKAGVSTTSSDNSISADSAMSAGNSMPVNCKSMMIKAHPMMVNMIDSNKKALARQQVEMANTAMSAGNENACMSHMKIAMEDME